MTKLLTILNLSDPASLKRALTTALTAMVLLAINPLLLKLNIPPLSNGVIFSVAGVVAVYILQSGLKSEAIAVAGLNASSPSASTAPPAATKPSAPAATPPAP
jgi:hypothetical protein